LPKNGEGGARNGRAINDRAQNGGAGKRGATNQQRRHDDGKRCRERETSAAWWWRVAGAVGCREIERGEMQCGEEEEGFANLSPN